MSVAVISSNGSLWNTEDLDFVVVGGEIGYLVDAVCNEAIQELSDQCGGGKVEVYVQIAILLDPIQMRDNVIVDFCGGRCRIWSDVSAVLFSNCSGATLRNAKIYPLDPGLVTAGRPQTTPVILLSASNGNSTSNNLIESIQVFPATSMGYQSCRYDTRCASTYSWQEHPGVQLYHETDGILESNCIRNLRIDGVRAAVEFYAADNSKSSARCNLISDIHSDHARSMIRFALGPDVVATDKASLLERCAFNVFEHVKVQPFCRGEFGVVGVSGLGNHFVASMINDFYASFYNPCRGYEYDVTEAAQETYICVPYIRSLMNCSGSTILMWPVSPLIDQCVSEGECTICSMDCFYSTEDNPICSSGACPEPGNTACTSPDKVTCLAERPGFPCSPRDQASQLYPWLRDEGRDPWW